MDFKTNLKKIGTSNHFLMPNALIKVYDLLKYTQTHEYSISIEKNGRQIVLNRVKKVLDEKQTTLDTFK